MFDLLADCLVYCLPGLLAARLVLPTICYGSLADRPPYYLSDLPATCLPSSLADALLAIWMHVWLVGRLYIWLADRLRGSPATCLTHRLPSSLAECSARRRRLSDQLLLLVERLARGSPGPLTVCPARWQMWLTVCLTSWRDFLGSLPAWLVANRLTMLANCPARKLTLHQPH